MITEFDFEQIAEIADSLEKHAIVESDFIKFIIIPYNGKIYKVEYELTMDDILDGESTTLNIHEVINWTYVDNEDED